MVVSSLNAFESDLHVWVSEASELGFPVLSHEWPDQLETTLGNREPLVLTRRTAEYAEYRQSLGVVSLRVFND